MRFFNNNGICHNGCNFSNNCISYIDCNLNNNGISDIFRDFNNNGFKFNDCIVLTIMLYVIMVVTFTIKVQAIMIVICFGCNFTNYGFSYNDCNFNNHCISYNGCNFTNHGTIPAGPATFLWNSTKRSRNFYV